MYPNNYRIVRNSVLTLFVLLSSLPALTLTWTPSISPEASGPAQPSSAPSCDEGRWQCPSEALEPKGRSVCVCVCVSATGRGVTE